MKKIILAAVILLFLHTACLAQRSVIKSGDSLVTKLDRFYSKNPRINGVGLAYMPFNNASRQLAPIAPANKSQGIYMPNAFTQKLQLAYLGSNENGLSIYRSTPDNMFILKPDSTFFSPMPVK